MRKDERLDLGSVHVHKQALAEIVHATLCEIDGASPIEPHLGYQLMGYWGHRTFPGIDVIVDENNDVSMDVKVNVRFGLNIPDIGRVIQDEIRAAIDKSVNIHLKDVNIHIHGIERGKK